MVNHWAIVTVEGLCARKLVVWHIKIRQFRSFSTPPFNFENIYTFNGCAAVLDVYGSGDREAEAARRES